VTGDDGNAGMRAQAVEVGPAAGTGVGDVWQVRVSDVAYRGAGRAVVRAAVAWIITGGCPSSIVLHPTTVLSNTIGLFPSCVLFGSCARDDGPWSVFPDHRPPSAFGLSF